LAGFEVIIVGRFCSDHRGKRLKRSPQLRDAMTEYETKLKIYRPDWDAKEMIEAACEQAQHAIEEHPEEFEDI
jgi:hypothetical protein